MSANDVSSTSDHQPLPEGVRLNVLVRHSDDRGWLCEIYRASWDGVVPAVQWNLVRSRAETLRGVHVHGIHWDYLVGVTGLLQVGLRDLRRDSPTHGRTAVVELDGERTASVVIPPGVAHGFFSPIETLHAYGVSHDWDTADELACHWNDPALEIPWNPTPRWISPRDEAAGSLSEMVERLEMLRPPRFS